jgi:mono/diheme cytochrome c family protein
MRRLKTFSAIAVSSVILLAGWTVSTVHSEDDLSADPAARGKYLVTAGGCHDCHSPKVFTEKGPEPDMALALSGAPAGAVLPEVPTGILGPDKWGAVCSNDLTTWVGPWGVSFASNLTPDKKSGLGEWTEQQFIDALRKGKHRGFGRQILPPMPWFNLALLTDDDLKAIFAYLQTLPAISNKVPDPIPPAGK